MPEDRGLRFVVRGQKVDAVKVARAKALRQDPTPEESIVWQCLRANQVQGWHFRRQQVIDGFIVDFYCHSAGVVVEIDGPIHEQQAAYDAERDRILAARGLRQMRVRNEDVRRDLPGVLRQIAEACGTSPPAPPLRGEGRLVSAAGRDPSAEFPLPAQGRGPGGEVP